SIQSKIKELSDKEKEMSQEISELKLSLKSNEYKVETLSKELGNYSKDITSISLILDDLKLDNRFDCELKLIDKTSLLKSELFNLELKINELNSKLKDLENNEGLSLANELIDNFELVLDVYPSAMLGRDFIKSLSIEDKDIYLSKTTLIPYSIVLNDQDYKALLKNSSLQEKMGDFLTPIINLTAIKSNSRIDTSIMYFNTLSKEVFIDEDRRLEEISKLEKELLKEENTYTKLEEELKATEKQLKDISLVNSKYDDNFEEAKNKELLDLKENTSTIEKDIEYKNKSLLDLDEEKSKLDKDIEDIRKKIIEHEEFLKRETSKINAYIDDLQEDTLINNLNTENLNKLNSKVELYLANKVAKKECEESKNKLNEDINAKLKSIESLKLNINTVNLEIASIKATRFQLEEVKKEKENLKAENTLKLKEVDRYKKEIPDGTKEKETNLSVEELREQVDIFNRNYKKEFSQIEELEKEIKHTKDNISRKKVEIESIKVSFEELDSRADMIIYNDINIFNSISKRLDSINAQIDELNKSIESTNTKKIQTETTIDNKTLDMNSI
ncbi:MAG: hypothetical protein IJH34_03570, partial [Romboutsia sp.]|nr:hypothetical protein [Romboutsia sp.]